MSDISDFQRDPVDGLLDCGRSTADDDLRRTLLLRTTGVIRRRRRTRRFGVAIALVACYLAGMATMHARRPAGPAPVESIARQSVAPRPQRAADRAVATTEKAPFEVLRQLSDRYLEQENDVTAALRYYRRALDTASDQQRAISLERDTWLLMALKASRMKETRHENGT